MAGKLGVSLVIAVRGIMVTPTMLVCSNQQLCFFGINETKNKSRIKLLVNVWLIQTLMPTVW